MKSMFFSIKYRYSDILLKKKHKLHLSRLFCCNHIFNCVNMVSVKYMLYNVSVMLSPALLKQNLDVHPWSDSTEFRGIGRGSSD